MDHPLFIVGNDRSGTTMLRLILDAGPEIAIPPESMILTDYGAVQQGGELGDRAIAQRFMAEVWHHPKIALWQLSGPPPEVPPGLDHASAYRFVMQAPFRAYAAQAGKPRWGDKTPHYVHHIAALLDVWPRARFVILVRDGRDVALSVRRMPFGPNNAWAAASWWARGIRAGQAAAAAHPEAVMTVRYEDLVADPQRRVPEICAFAGLTFAPEMLAIEKADRAKIVADQTGWFPGLFDGIHTAASGRWQREMPARDQRIFASLAGPELRAFGYPPGPGRPPLAGWQERLLHWHNQTMRQVNFVRLRVFQERGRELRHALERRMRPEGQRGRRVRR
ncbi:MAG TPA: sulfotransferase [Solirubrobacteraceae bacterium]|nr:sulfotransferase [Solirubrobacteraceae bacterium]